MDLYKRNLDDEKRVLGTEKLTSIEERINDLKSSLFELANKRKEKEEVE